MDRLTLGVTWIFPNQKDTQLSYRWLGVKMSIEPIFFLTSNVKLGTFSFPKIPKPLTSIKYALLYSFHGLFNMKSFLLLNSEIWINYLINYLVSLNWFRPGSCLVTPAITFHIRIWGSFCFVIEDCFHSPQNHVLFLRKISVGILQDVFGPAELTLGIHDDSISMNFLPKQI